jgi:acetate kinase
MGTRCGSIDPAVVTFVMEHEHMTASEVNDLLNKKSGLLGVSGVSNDMRTVVEALTEGNDRALLAYSMFANSVKKYIGQYMALMAGVDVVVLTGGIGENSPDIRRAIFAGMQPMGIVVDNMKNHQRGFERIISHEKSKVRICVVPTNEELMIARDTYEIVHERSQIVPYSEKE